MLLNNLPNILTITRILLIPVLILCFYISGSMGHYAAAGIFIFASITDYIDGYIARTWSAESNFGRMLDPIADKLLIASTLMMLVHFNRAPVIPAIAILCREILVSGLREFLSELKIVMPVNHLGKIKTACQMIAIVILLLDEKVIGVKYLNFIGHIGIWCTAALTLISGYAYFREGVKHIVE